ncbi:MAG: MFS transporter [Anaerolineae bacterium]|nr:MFS transporter [Anaerolineae bacterium]
MSQTAKQALLPSEERRNIRHVILDGIGIGLISAGGSFVSVFVVRLGASPFWVSLLSSIPATIALLTTLPWSRFLERQTRPQIVLSWSRLSGYMMYLPVALLPFVIKGEWTPRLIVILWSLTALTGSLTNLAFTLTMGHAVPPHRRAFLMSRRWMVMGIAQSLALPVVSWLIDNLTFPLGYQIVFMLNVGIAFWSFFWTRKIQVEKEGKPREATVQHLPRRVPRYALELASLKESLLEVWQTRPFFTFISGKVLFHLGLAMVGALINIYWINHLDFSDTWVGTMATTSTVATLLAYLPWVRIKRKIGTWKLTVVSVLGCSLYPVLLAQARSPGWTLPVVAFNGIIGAGLNLAFFDALLEVCPPHKEERFVAFNAVAMHLTGVVGPPIGAALLTLLDIRWVMATGSLVALGGVGVFVWASLKKGARPIEPSPAADVLNSGETQDAGQRQQT